MTYYTVILFAILVGCARSPETENPAQIYVKALSMALEKDQIGRVEILQIPARILTTGQVSPEALERQFHNKLVIRDIAATAYRNKVVDRFKTVSVQPRTETADLRWGVIFYSRDDTRAGAVYFDRNGHFGSVNSLPVSLQGDFFHWLDDTFSGCLQ